jgi:DNA-binding LytR/AlgR family response regulator
LHGIALRTHECVQIGPVDSRVGFNPEQSHLGTAPIAMEAANAAEAIQILSTADASIEVVFSDIQMPGEMDGFGLARWVRGNKPNSKMILTSGYNRSAQIAGELCEGHPILAKPYESSTVVDRIKRLLAQLPDEL